MRKRSRLLINGVAMCVLSMGVVWGYQHEPTKHELSQHHPAEKMQTSHYEQNSTVGIEKISVLEREQKRLSSRGMSLNNLDTLTHKTSQNKSSPEKKPTKQYWNVPVDHNLQDYISKKCKDYGVPERMVYGVIYVETGGKYDYNEVSYAGSYGIMQINRSAQYKVIEKLGATDLFNPYQNVNVGIYILSELYKKYGYTQAMFIAYNEGIGGAESTFSSGIYSTSYSRSVEQAMNALKKVD